MKTNTQLYRHEGQWPNKATVSHPLPEWKEQAIRKEFPALQEILKWRSYYPTRDYDLPTSLFRVQKFGGDWMSRISVCNSWDGSLVESFEYDRLYVVFKDGSWTEVPLHPNAVMGSNYSGSRTFEQRGMDLGHSLAQQNYDPTSVEYYVHIWMKFEWTSPRMPFSRREVSILRPVH